MRYLYQPGELEGGTKRATDPIWSLKVYQIERNVTKPNEPVVYYLSDGPKAALFVKSCWLCRLIHSFRPPDVFVPYASVRTPSSASQRFVSNGDIEILFMHIPHISWPSLLQVYILCINCFLPKSASL